MPVRVFLIGGALRKVDVTDGFTRMSQEQERLVLEQTVVLRPITVNCTEAAAAHFWRNCVLGIKTYLFAYYFMLSYWFPLVHVAKGGHGLISHIHFVVYTFIFYESTHEEEGSRPQMRCRNHPILVLRGTRFSQGHPRH